MDPADLDRLPSNDPHPVDLLEPEDDRGTAYREAAKILVAHLTRAVDWVLESDRPRLAAWELAFAYGLIQADGVSMSEVAADHGETRQALSKRVLRYSRSLGLPPSTHQKSEAARGSYRDARASQLDE